MNTSIEQSKIPYLQQDEEDHKSQDYMQKR